MPSHAVGLGDVQKRLIGAIATQSSYSFGDMPLAFSIVPEI
jgi:hypothetical protein